VTARGTTEIPRELRERYRVAPKSRLRWMDTGQGLLIIPVEQPVAPKNGRRHRKPAVETRPENLEAIKILREWMQEPDDWTSEQWDDFQRELRTNRLRFRDVEL